ncbi:MAG: PIN domain-containing protein [Gaiellaceae bacterium]
MTLLDAYALIALLLDEPPADQVEAIVRLRTAGATTVNLVEAFDVSARVHGLPLDRARSSLDVLLDDAIAVIPLDRAVAERASELRVRHYHRSRCPISLADSVLIASAGPGDRIATADPDVLRVAAAEGIATLELPGQG